MLNKILMSVSVLLLCSACTPSNSDGSDATTYSSCSITESSALFAADRASDVSQCWDGKNYEERSLALDWCSTEVNSYMSRYTLGHSIEYQVTSTNCPD